MNFDSDKVDEAVLALLWLTSFQNRDTGARAAWRGHDWDALDRLHARGLIADPKNRSKSLTFTDDGAEQARRVFEKLFGKPE